MISAKILFVYETRAIGGEGQFEGVFADETFIDRLVSRLEAFGVRVTAIQHKDFNESHMQYLKPEESSHSDD